MKTSSTTVYTMTFPPTPMARRRMARAEDAGFLASLRRP
jgi:hypothetical protein